MLDTAAGTDAVNRRVAEELHLPLVEMGTRANVGAGDGVTRIAFAPNVQISLGDVNYANSRVGAIPLDSVSRGFGEPFDGALGYDLLSRWVVTIDYQQHKLLLHSNAVPTVEHIEADLLRGRGRVQLHRNRDEAEGNDARGDRARGHGLTLLRSTVDRDRVPSPVS